MNNPIIEVTYKIRNPHNRDIRIEIEKGNVIENKDDVYGRQSLVVIKSIETTIEANTTKEVIVETHCINPKKKSPYECNVRPTPIIFEVDIDDMMNRRIIWKIIKDDKKEKSKKLTKEIFHEDDKKEKSKKLTKEIFHVIDLDKLSDIDFKEFCFNILSNVGRFENVIKVWETDDKSKRVDIIVYERAKHLDPPEIIKWVVKCIHSKKKITTSKLPNPKNILSLIEDDGLIIITSNNLTKKAKELIKYWNQKEEFLINCLERNDIEEILRELFKIKIKYFNQNYIINDLSLKQPGRFKSPTL